jgi:peroxiredoxin/glutaredoxin
MKAPNVGDKAPDVTLPARVNGDWTQIKTGEFFKGKTVVLFGLPGAFTPTCSSAHVPRYVELKDAFKAKGVDEIVCVSVNDAFVMESWQKDQGAESITFWPDGNGTFSEALGLLVDKAVIGFGKRSWRYALVIKDGVITHTFVEPDKPGDPYEVSDADTVLKALSGNAPPDIVMFTKPGCSHCARAKKALSEAKLEFAELPTNPRILRALPGERTTPQIFIDGKHIGGAEQLVAWIGQQKR